MKYLKIEMAKMSSQTSNKCQTSTMSRIIEIPFPPRIRASDIVNKRKPSRVKSKSPNAFLIYRKAFLDQLSNENHNLRMTDVSKLVSNYWRNEADYVKEAYKKIAQEVEVELNEKRKKTVSYRVVWKNSKYSSRKRNQLGKVSGNNKSDVNTKIKATSVSPNRENVFYQFVPAFPDVEFPKSSTKKQKEINSTPLEPKITLSKNSQNLELSNYQEPINTNVDVNFEYHHFNPTATTFLLDNTDPLNWYLQDFLV